LPLLEQPLIKRKTFDLKFWLRQVLPIDFAYVFPVDFAYVLPVHFVYVLPFFLASLQYFSVDKSAAAAKFLNYVFEFSPSSWEDQRSKHIFGAVKDDAQIYCKYHMLCWSINPYVGSNSKEEGYMGTDIKRQINKTTNTFSCIVGGKCSHCI
jgi:hypothetical protein